MSFIATVRYKPNRFSMVSFYDRIISFFNGLVGGAVSVLAMQPFETIKIRLQTQSKEAPLYSGIIDCIKKMIKNEGPLSLYKGTLTPLIGIGVLGSIRFGSYENFKKELAIQKGSRLAPGKLELQEKVIAGLGAGIVSSAPLCMVEHTRIRIQIQKSQADKIYSGSVDAAIKIYQKYGIKGLLRGQGPTSVRQSIGLCIYFAVLQKVTAVLTPKDCHHHHDLPLYVSVISGGLAGSSYWGSVYPFDYVKTQMQSDKFGEFKYPNMASVFRQHYEKGGISTFFKGYRIGVMGGFPASATLVVAYRAMQRLTGAHSH